MQYWKSIWKKRSKRVDPCCQYYFSSFLFFPIIVRCSLLWKRDQRLTSFSTQWCHFRRFRQEDFTRNEKDWKWLLKMRFILFCSQMQMHFSHLTLALSGKLSVKASINLKFQIQRILAYMVGTYGHHLLPGLSLTSVGSTSGTVHPFGFPVAVQTQFRRRRSGHNEGH